MLKNKRVVFLSSTVRLSGSRQLDCQMLFSHHNTLGNFPSNRPLGLIRLDATGYKRCSESWANYDQVTGDWLSVVGDFGGLYSAFFKLFCKSSER